MILVANDTGSKELLPIIQRLGVPAELCELPFGDFAFEGNGPKGPIAVGVERKALHDMLHCIDDARYSAHQMPGMREMYQKSYLMVEGLWRPHDPEGWLMQFHPSSQKWAYCNPGGRRVLYSKLRRYLFSVSLSDVTVMFTRDQFQTAYDVVELFHYFSKSWQNHTSLLEVQKLNIPNLGGKPSLVRRWASDLEDIGVKYSLEAERMFKHPINLAQASEFEWMRIKGIGVRTAQKIVREIQGWR